MKRLTTAILAFLYMGTSMGATLNMHFCMGKPAVWSVSIGKSGTCPECGVRELKAKDKGCCSDEQKNFKTSNDQNVANLSFQAICSLEAAIPLTFFDAPAAHVISIIKANPLSNTRPQAGSVAIYIRNHVFRI